VPLSLQAIFDKRSTQAYDGIATDMRFAREAGMTLITLTEDIFVAPQIDVAAVAEARQLGISLIINNRPEDESPDQTPGGQIEIAARAAGINYVAIPVGHGGFSQPQVDAMVAALEGAEGKILAYCRSGTRSTLLWALAEAKTGADPETLSDIAGRAGYDLSPIRPLLDMLKGQA
jgi:uncharacterized protein (TIGR01244 family)